MCSRSALRLVPHDYTKSPIDNRRLAEDLVHTSGVVVDMCSVREIAASLKDIARLLEDGVEESRKARHVWEKIHQRLETNAEIEQHVASEGRRWGGFL